VKESLQATEERARQLEVEKLEAMGSLMPSTGSTTRWRAWRTGWSRSETGWPRR
jgi:hypothetical protein